MTCSTTVVPNPREDTHYVQASTGSKCIKFDRHFQPLTSSDFCSHIGHQYHCGSLKGVFRAPYPLETLERYLARNVAPWSGKHHRRPLSSWVTCLRCDVGFDIAYGQAVSFVGMLHLGHECTDYMGKHMVLSRFGGWERTLRRSRERFGYHKYMTYCGQRLPPPRPSRFSLRGREKLDQFETFAFPETNTQRGPPVLAPFCSSRFNLVGGHFFGLHGPESLLTLVSKEYDICVAGLSSRIVCRSHSCKDQFCHSQNRVFHPSYTMFMNTYQCPYPHTRDVKCMNPECMYRGV
jgi:hypothetical protein